MVTMIPGTPDDDVLEGTPGPDLIRGLAGNDVIFGRAGDDQLHGGLGDDEIWGHRGADVIYGGAGNDVLHGNRGADQLFGGAGDDELFGGLGPDRLHGGPGNDRLFGGRGDDWLYGGPGQDTLTGGPGADVFVYRAAGDGLDRITDFSPDDGDTLRFAAALTGAAVRMVDDGTNSLENVDGGRFTLHPSRPGEPLDRQPVSLPEDATYNLKVRNERIDGFDRTYSLKVWEQGEAEPADWLVQGTESFSELMTGSFLLNAHYYVS